MERDPPPPGPRSWPAARRSRGPRAPRTAPKDNCPQRARSGYSPRSMAYCRPKGNETQKAPCELSSQSGCPLHHPPLAFASRTRGGRPRRRGGRHRPGAVSPADQGPRPHTSCGRPSRPLTGAVHYVRRSSRERMQPCSPPAECCMPSSSAGTSRPRPASLIAFRSGRRTTAAFRFTHREGGRRVRSGSAPSATTGSGTALRAYRNASLLRREGVEFLLALGDNAYQLGNRPRVPPRAVSGRSRPVDASRRAVAEPGQPRLRQRGRGVSWDRSDAYLRNFVLPRDPGRERFYSFRYANAEFLAIDYVEVALPRARKPAIPMDRRDLKVISLACWVIIPCTSITPRTRST